MDPVKTPTLEQPAPSPQAEPVEPVQPQPAPEADAAGSLPQPVPGQPEPKGYLEHDYGGAATVSSIGMLSVSFGILIVALGIYAIFRAKKLKEKK